jgi:hypothetical protein
MNQKTRRAERTLQEPCICQGAGPALTEFLRRLGPPLEARRHFEAARVEFLKGLRALLDARIEQITKSGAKGEKIPVE